MLHQSEIDLKYYALLVRRRLRLILVTVAVCILAAVFLNVATEPVYRANTRIEVGKESDRSPITGEAVAGSGWNSDNVALNTAAELLTNRELLREVVISLRANGEFVTDPPRSSAVRGFFGKLLSHVPVVDSLGVAHAAVGAESDADMNADIDWFMLITHVRPIPDTRLVLIQVDHWIPDVAKAMADTLATKFVAYEARQRAATEAGRLGFLKQQLSDLKGQIDESERVLYSSHELGLSALDGQVKQQGDAVGHLNESYVSAKTERLAVEGRLKLVRAALKDSLMAWDDVPVQNEAVQGLWKDLMQTRTELARAREVYKSKHPRLMMLQSQLQSEQDNLRVELHKAVGALQTEYEMVKGREDGLLNLLHQTEGELRATNDRANRYTALESELRSKRDLYAMLVAKAQELQISGEVQLGLSSVVEQATLDPDPVRPRPILNLIMGLIVGLTAGFGLALLAEYLRRTVKTPKDITDVLHLPILGMIPKSQT